MDHKLKAVSVLLVLALFSIGAHAHNNVVVIPLDSTPSSSKLIPGNTERVAKRAGFSAQYTQWSGDLCQKA